MSEVPAHRRRLGEAIRRRRRKAQMSQELLAEKSELNSKYLSEVERGKKTISEDSLARIATGLRCRLEQLFRGI